MPFNNKYITELDMEISSFCNAECIDCPRIWTQYDQVFAFNPYIDNFNKTVPLEDLKKHIAQFENLERIDMCGNKGDPLGHPDIAELVQWCFDTYDDMDLVVDTNGSLGNTKTWKALASTPVQVNFSIDGLEDTNHIYRRKVVWEKVMRNAYTFLGHGGFGVWKAVDFPHIRHQFDTMNHFSKAMGFKKFSVVPQHNPENAQKIVESSEVEINHTEKANAIPIGESELTKDHSTSLDWFEKNKIIPYCIRKQESKTTQSLYYENGKVYPCCTYAQNGYSEEHTRQQDDARTEELYGENWNSLYHHSLETILAGDYYSQYLENSWTDPNTAFKICKVKCGQCLTS